jgi:hypothetical protein
MWRQKEYGVQCETGRSDYGAAGSNPSAKITSSGRC